MGDNLCCTIRASPLFLPWRSLEKEMINSVSSPNFNFSVQSTAAPAAAPQGETIEFSYNSQDRLVKSADTVDVSGVRREGASLSTERVKLDASLKPNAEGEYVFDQETQPKSFTAAHSFASVVNTLKMFEEAYGQKVPWATRSEQLTVVPDGGEMLNACYSRDEGSVNFFHSLDPVTNEMIYSGQSGEAVSHEVGHAMLDGLRPDYLMAWSPDPGGFHEHFADMTGFLMATQDDATCEIVAKETGGDLTKDNSLSYTAEELGVAIGNSSGTDRKFIRNANNDFKWQDPSTLPHHAPPDQLGTEMHSWSQVYTGAMYDAFTKMVKRGMEEEGMTAAQAIKDCGAQFIELYAHTMKEAPRGDFSYKQMANCMLRADREYMGGKNQIFLREGFIGRNILPGGMSVQSHDYGAQVVRPMTVSLDGDFGMFSGAKVQTYVDAEKMYVNDSQSGEAKELRQNMKRLIDAGRILYTEPNQKIETKDLFDNKGVPYAGVVRWVDGNMVIERNTIIN